MPWRAVVLAVSITAVLAALWLLSQPPPTPSPLPWAPERLHLGINVDLTTHDDAALDSTLGRLAQLGLTTVRQRFDWNRIEPAAGQFTWDAYDRIVAAANANDLELLAVLDGSPAWARAAVDSANPLAPPQERADFGRFAAHVAARYAGKINFYQVWDEPNIAPHWGAR
ncbi:MAG: beta-galactosidase, partial [Anaerolineae bacterium]